MVVRFSFFTIYRLPFRCAFCLNKKGEVGHTSSCFLPARFPDGMDIFLRTSHCAGCFSIGTEKRVEAKASSPSQRVCRKNRLFCVPLPNAMNTQVFTV